jgi:branched-chain amino acid transport system ATP-binding protein
VLHGSGGELVENDLALEVSEMDVHYKDFQALWNVSLEVKKGEIVSVIGANGAGKSTLLNTVSGLLTPSRGTVQFFGERIDGQPDGAHGNHLGP